MTAPQLVPYRNTVQQGHLPNPHSNLCTPSPDGLPLENHFTGALSQIGGLDPNANDWELLWYCAIDPTVVSLEYLRFGLIVQPTN